MERGRRFAIENKGQRKRDEVMVRYMEGCRRGVGCAAAPGEDLTGYTLQGIHFADAFIQSDLQLVHTDTDTDLVE